MLALYKQPTSWTLGYNLFADTWLGTELVEPSVGLYVSVFPTQSLIILQIYDNQSNFINKLLLDPYISHFGLPVNNLDLGRPITVSSRWVYFSVHSRLIIFTGWNLFVAAMTSNNDLRSNLIERIYNRSHLFSESTAGAFPLVYNSANGSDIQGSQGSEFPGVFR